MKHSMHIIIDATSSATNIGELWKECGFIEKLRSLGGQTVILSAKPRTWPGNLKVIANFNQLPIDPGDTIIGITSAQLFLDLDIAAAGISRFHDHGGAYFTQWEHCRLPVGIGIRAYSADMLCSSGAANFDELQDYLFANRESLSFLYDDIPYVSYEESLLESRLAPTEAVDEWNLQGFLAIANKTSGIRYQRDPDALCVDDRGMPAAYGFESTDCADFPTYVMFDMTNKCNAKCIHCPHSVGFLGSEKPEFIDVDVYKNVIDQCRGRNMDFIRITADGEPLLHPQIWELLDYAREQGVGPIGLTSNGSALNKDNALRLLISGIFMVDFSLDAFSEKTFELVRAGLSYRRTHDNVMRLLKMRDERGDSLKIIVSFVNQKENTHELEAFKNYWEPLVDKVLIREMHTNVGVNDNTGTVEPEQVSRYPCPHLFRRTTADYGGDLKFCPIDWQGSSKLARTQDISIAEAWHGESYREHRLQHLNNVFSSQSICADCEDWKSTPWDLGYEKIVKELADVDPI